MGGKNNQHNRVKGTFETYESVGSAVIIFHKVICWSSSFFMSLVEKMEYNERVAVVFIDLKIDGTNKKNKKK